MANEHEAEAPEEAGVPAPEPDDAHREGAHMLANDARDELHADGHDDEQIRRWAEAYLDHEDAGGADDFVAWVRAREHDTG